VLISVVYGKFATGTSPPGKVEAISNILTSIAGALASVSGFLSATIVLGLQFHAQSLGNAAFLLRYLVRREGLLPLSAIFLATICSNLVVALIASIWIPQAVISMLLLNILAPIAIDFNTYLMGFFIA